MMMYHWSCPDLENPVLIRIYAVRIIKIIIDCDIKYLYVSIYMEQDFFPVDDEGSSETCVYRHLESWTLQYNSANIAGTNLFKDLYVSGRNS